MGEEAPFILIIICWICIRGGRLFWFSLFWICMICNTITVVLYISTVIWNIDSFTWPIQGTVPCFLIRGGKIIHAYILFQTPYKGFPSSPSPSLLYPPPSLQGIWLACIADYHTPCDWWDKTYHHGDQYQSHWKIRAISAVTSSACFVMASITVCSRSRWFWTDINYGKQEDNCDRRKYCDDNVCRHCWYMLLSSCNDHQKLVADAGHSNSNANQYLKLFHKN